MTDWKPGPVVARALRRLQQRIAVAITGAAPRVPHRGDAAGPVGGSLAREVRDPALVGETRTGAVLRLSRLGDRLSLFVRGTRRQRPRPVPLAIDEETLARDLEEDLVRCFEQEDGRLG